MSEAASASKRLQNGEITMSMDTSSSAAKTGERKRRGGGGSNHSTLSPSMKGEAVSGRGSSTRAVWTGRILFVICLSAVAATLGFTAHYVISQSETTLTETQFRSITERALNEAVGIAHQRRWAAATMASMVSELLPNADDWPFVYVTGFERIVGNLLQASRGKDVGFIPIVKPEEREAWEDFAYDYYSNVRDPPFPNGTAVNSFGKGIWRVNASLPPPKNRYHDTTGETDYGSPNQILTPVFHVDEGAHRVLLYNLHSEKRRGFAMDDLIECWSQQRNQLSGDEADGSDGMSCATVTTRIDIRKHDNFPGAVIFHPIFAASNVTELVGIIPTALLFHDVLQDIFADEVSGVDCVLETETDAITYTVTDGAAHLVGEGDLHQRRYDGFRQFALLTGQGLYTKNSANYTLSMYPNNDLYHVYSTSNPTYAMIGVVCAIVVTSLFFFLYDYAVRRDANEKKELLKAKRVFMRYVSHEVRTPLNTVCMGLALLQEEMTAALRSSNDGPNDCSDSTSVPKNSVESEAIVSWLDVSQQVLTSAQSAVDVFTDILHYDKIESGTFTLELAPVPVFALINRTLLEFTLAAAQKKIDYRVYFHAKLNDKECRDYTLSPLDILEMPSDVASSMLVGDSVRMTQVLRNLVSNAVKFTPEGGTLTVQTIWRKLHAGSKAQSFTLSNGDAVSYTQNAVLEVTVSDTGAGMTEEQLRRLFAEGVQFNVNSLQAGHGSGLGLYITKGIVEQHFGTLTVSSKGLDQGTTFVMSLPLFDVPDAPVQVQNDDSEAFVCRSIAEPSALNILVVDDAPLNRKLLSNLLTKRGHHCDQAQDGSEAVQQVENAMSEGRRYDTILLDYEMPVMNGPTAAKEIRSMGVDSFIVGVTGNILPEDIDYFKSCGVNAVMPKPFRVPDLEELWIEYGVTDRSTSFSCGSTHPKHR